MKDLFKNKNILYIFIILLFIVMMGLGATFLPNPFSKKLDLNLGTYSEPALVSDENLRIIQSTPTGELDEAGSQQEVVVVFNHPIVPLTSLEEETKGMFEIIPKVAGKFRWYGTRICAFIPEKAWTPGQKYIVKVSKGVKSINEKVLNEEYQFSFQVLVPPIDLSIDTVIESVNVESEFDEYLYDYDSVPELAPIQKFVLQSSQKLSNKELAKGISIQADGKTIPIQLGRVLDEGKKIEFSNTKPFPKGSEVQVIIPEGIPSLDYPNHFSTEISKNYKVRGDLSLESQDCDFKSYQGRWYCRIIFKYPVRAEEVLSKLQISPNMEWTVRPTGIIKKIKLVHLKPEPLKKYVFNFSAGIKDIYGNSLLNKESIEVQVPGYQPSFNVDTYNASVIEADMKQLLPVDVANIPEMKVEVGTVNLDTVLKNIKFTQYGISYNYEHFDYWKYSGSKQETIWKTGTSPSLGLRAGFDIAPYLNSEHKGWVAVRFNKETTQFVQSTDLGMTIKSDYKAAHVWVHSLTKAQPVSGVKVTSYLETKSNGSCQTDENGYCTLPQGNMFYAEKGNDKAFTFSEVSIYSLLSYENFSEDAHKPLLNTVFFFDRKLYRPSEKMFWKALVGDRANGKFSPYANSKVKVKIVNANGTEVYTKELVTSKQGGIWGEYELNKEASLGHYTISLIAGNTDIGSDTFQVEEFKPVDFSVKIEGQKDGAVGENRKLKIQGTYLFGAPMSRAEVEYTIQRYSSSVSFSEYKDYIFGKSDIDENESRDYSNSGMFKQFNGKLGLDGALHFDLELPPMVITEVVHKPSFKEYRLSDSYKMVIEAKITDLNSRSVSNQESMRVSSGNLFPGIQIKERYQNYKQPFKFKILAVNQNGERVSTGQVAIRVIKKNWNSIRTVDVDTIQTKNTENNELIEETFLTISSTPLDYEFIPKDSGSYTLTVQDKNGMAFSKVSFYAWGGDFVGWERRDDNSFGMEAGKKEYFPGETAKILLRSPFPKCKAIISLERESLIWQKVIEIDEKGAPIEVPIQPEYAPNVYLSAVLIKPRLGELDEDDTGRPAIKASIIKINVNTKSKEIPVKISMEKGKFKPGEKVRLQIQTVPNAEVALTVADEGVLNLISYHNYPDPVGIFYFKGWPLGVKLFENRMMLIKQYVFGQKGENPGGDIYGDNGGGGFPFDSEDGTRRNIRYTAYWKPDLQSDANGNLNLEFDLPDNLTSFRIMAVASVDGKYGTSSDSFRVAKPMVVMGNVPRFIRPGDEIKIGGTVLNQTRMKGNFKVSLVSNLLDSANASQTIALGSGESKELSFGAKVNLQKYKEALKKGSILVEGFYSVEPSSWKEFGDKEYKKEELIDRIKFSFPILEVKPEEAFSLSHFVDTEEKEKIRLPGEDKVIFGSTSLDIVLSSSALLNIEKAFKFYNSNPYFCSEQRASAFLLALTSGDLLEKFSVPLPNKESYDFKNVESLFLKEIHAFQNPDGGFRFWKDTESKSSPYLSVYIAQVLQTARKAGYSIDSRVKDRSLMYLKNYLKNPEKDGISYITETMALIALVLTREGEDTDRLHLSLMSKQKDLSLRAKANLALSIAERKGLNSYKKNSDLEKLFADIQNSMEFTTRGISLKEGRGSYRRAFYSDGSAVGVVLQAIMKLDPTSPLIPKIVTEGISAKKNLWMDTHSVGSLAYSLKQYHDTFEQDSGKRETKLSLDSKLLAKAVFDGKALQTEQYHFGSEQLTFPTDKDLDFVIQNDKRARVYYTATLNYSPFLKEIKAREEGIEIKREIFDLSSANDKNPFGQKVKQNFNKGRVYMVKLTLTNPKPYEQVVISSPIPSNFEIVNSAFDTEERGLRKVPMQKNESEYWWEDSSPRMEYRDDKMVMTNSYLYAGVHEYFFLVRPAQSGKAFFPATEAKLMYEPEIFGRTDGFQSNVN